MRHHHHQKNYQRIAHHTQKIALSSEAYLERRGIFFRGRRQEGYTVGEKTGAINAPVD
jgi:hypothetical protein